MRRCARCARSRNTRPTSTLRTPWESLASSTGWRRSYSSAARWFATAGRILSRPQNSAPRSCTARRFRISRKSTPRSTPQTAPNKSTTPTSLPGNLKRGLPIRPRVRRSPRSRVRPWKASAGRSSAPCAHSTLICCSSGSASERAMREPSFWWREPGLTAAFLSPFASVYGAIAAGRLKQQGTRVSVPVICVGNFTVGGAGKTPAAIAVARILADAGERPFFLSRGYGGKQAGPLRVDAAAHNASDVGDEALLLAHSMPAIVSRDRVAGARAAIAAGASVIVMDDGLQNPSLTKDFTIAVVDSRRGIGNGKVFPAGPLRAPFAVQLVRTDALLIVGNSADTSGVTAAAQASNLPVLHGRLVPDPAAVTAL